MRTEYERNRKIAIYGNSKQIVAAIAVLDTLDDIEGRLMGYRLVDEGEIRLKIQTAIDDQRIQADILVDGNNVYPYKKIINEYERLRKSGRLEKMSNGFYQFLYLNFDIAHYDKAGYICHYCDCFPYLWEKVLRRASTPAWHTDVQRLISYFQAHPAEEGLSA